MSLHSNPQPTPYEDVNALLRTLRDEVRRILGPAFVGMYLSGSLALENFVAGSDVDVVVATAGALSVESVAALRTMHQRLYERRMSWVDQLEIVYIPIAALRRHDPANADFPHLDRGTGDQLQVMTHHTDWVVHRVVLRERGIVLAGPPPAALIDSISADELRQAQCELMRFWWAPIARGEGEAGYLDVRGYQSYAVLTMCRMLYTLRTGEITSKSGAARWARATIDPRWAGLIERADAWRTDGPPDETALATDEDCRATRDLIRLVERECGAWASAR